jgi:hypothetical protein
MTGVPKELTEHALQIIPGSKPVRQAMRRFRDEKCRAIAKEISKLLKAGFIKEVIHTKWVANPVLVPKKKHKSSAQVCRLHWPEQSMSKRPLSLASH